MGVYMNKQKYTMKDKAFWNIVIGLGTSAFFIFGTMYSMQPILPILTKNYDITISFASLSMSLTTVGLIIGLIVIGFLSDLKGRTFFIHFSIISTACLLFIIPMMNSFLLIIFFRLLQGFTLAGVLGAALAYMTEEIDQKHVGFAATLYIACNSLGGMIGRFITGFLAEAISWQIALYILGAFGLLTFVFVFLTLPKSMHFERSTGNFTEEMKGFLVHFKNPTLLLMFGLGIVLQVSFTGMWTFLPFHLLDAPYELSLQQISYFYFAYSLGVVGAPIAGLFASKYRLSTIRITGIVFLVLGLLITLGKSLFAIIIGLCIICLGFFVSHSIATATVSQEAQHHKGSASSIYLVAYYIGVSTGTTLLVPLWEKFGWHGIVLFTTILPITYVIIVKLTQFQMNKVTSH